MEFQLLGIFAFLSVGVVACHAALSPEAYWKSVIPNTPMPGAVKDSLSTAEWEENKGTAVGVGKGGVIVGGNYRGKPVFVGVTPSANPFIYNYAATEDQLHDDPNVALFFKKNDLQQGNHMKLHFTKTTNAATFLPRSAAGKIPFSAVKLPQILSRFSLSPDSKEARVMKKTLKECEEPAMMGEEKLCATSLESMVDFSVSQLGKNVKAISTEGGKKREVPQKYAISGSKNMGKDGKAVVCHKQSYAYAVFYCHKTQSTEVYEVSLVGADDGAKVKAVAVCHKDTSTWNPNHLAFQVLKVKPGTVPVAVVACHAALSPEAYWKSVIPNTPMPGAVKVSLSTAEWEENKGTAVGVGKGGVNVSVSPGASPFNYMYAATEDQLHDDPNVALFFKNNDLQQGNMMKLHFTKTTNAATFLPRSAAGKIPFSAVKLPQILSRFSLSPDSEEARVIKKTLEECEAPAIMGEEKLCATSLESIWWISAYLSWAKTLRSKSMLGKDGKVVVCHKQSYAYAVFYCHKTQSTEVYEVSLVGVDDGAKVKAVAICHKDTSAWNPNHLAFQVLKVKPGTVPVCHFLPDDHVVWVN
nr:BURP domain protein RD22-like [Ipomoea batatas]